MSSQQANDGKEPESKQGKKVKRPPMRRTLDDIDFEKLLEDITKRTSHPSYLGEITHDVRNGADSARGMMMLMAQLMTPAARLLREFSAEFSGEIPSLELTKSILREIGREKVLSLGSNQGLWESLMVYYGTLDPEQIICTDKFILGWFGDFVPDKYLLPMEEDKGAEAEPSEAAEAAAAEEPQKNKKQKKESGDDDTDSDSDGEDPKAGMEESKDKDKGRKKPFLNCEGNRVELGPTDSICEIDPSLIEDYRPYGLPIQPMDHIAALKKYGAQCPVLLLIDPLHNMFLDSLRFFWGDTIIYVGPSPWDAVYDDEGKLAKSLARYGWEIHKIFELRRFMVLYHRSHVFVIKKRKNDD